MASSSSFNDSGEREKASARRENSNAFETSGLVASLVRSPHADLLAGWGGTHRRTPSWRDRRTFYSLGGFLNLSGLSPAGFWPGRTMGLADSFISGA